MDSIKAPANQDINALSGQMGNLALDGDIDLVMKPRTNFTNNVLRRAIPNINIQDKIGSISMNKLNVLSAMRLSDDGSHQQREVKKVRTVSNLPKVMSLDSRMMKDILGGGDKGGHIKKES